MDRRAFRTHDPDGTRALGAALGGVATPGSVILLSGRLGAGKTTFAQGVAQGLGIVGDVVSPSFTLVREYEGASGRPGLTHMDFYRLGGPAEVRHLGVDDYWEQDEVKLIEWPERAVGALPEDALTIALDCDATDDGDVRRIVMSAHGASAQALLAALEAPLAVTEVSP